MKYLLIAIICLVSACDQDQEPEFGSEINFSIKGGSYEAMRVQTWDDKSPICASVAIMSGNYETKWLPMVGLRILSEDEKNNASVMLVANSKNAKELQLVYRLSLEDNKINDPIVLKDHIKLGEKIRLDVFFTEVQEMGIRLDNNGRVFVLPFEPKILTVSGSSAKSQIKFSTETCEAGHKTHAASSKTDSTKAK